MKRYIKFLSVIFLCLVVVPTYSATRATVARAGATQKAINLGTKVEESRATSSSCQDKYNACMDSGCMIDNESGGRCQCSNKFKELNEILNQIKKKDLQNQKVLSAAEQVIDEQKYGASVIRDDMYADDEDIDEVKLSGSIGDKLRSEMHAICIEKIPECKSQFSLVTNLYSQKIKSDCAAFENALKEQQQSVREKRAEVKKSVRANALAQYKESNKYDLGQCTIQFTECMKTTAECGYDFSGCVDSVGHDNIYGKAFDQVAIEGVNSSVLIAKSTLDVLESKKVICESVTKQCTNVADQVWDSFLKNALPEIKMAELKSESDIRTSCLSKMSNCFQKACKDNIESTDVDSYDMCLTRPDTMKSLCRVEIEPCLAATGGSFDKPEESTLWPSVLSKLSAMRVDSCTEEIKTCMQSPDRCGPDYSQCIGLDTNLIMRMCPYDKLPGCQKVYGEDVVKGDAIYDEVAQIVEGVILNIDNKMLETCQAAADSAVENVCGGDDMCQSFAVKEDLGSRSLKYQVCQYSTNSPDSTEGFKWFDCRESVDMISDAELGRVKGSKTGELGSVKPFAGVITGIIKWESVEITDDGYIDIESYIDALKKENIEESERMLVRSELEQLQDDINRVIRSVETDQWLQFCVSGRNVPGVTDMFGENTVRFPKLADSVRKQISVSALAVAKNNYYQKYDILTQRMQHDLVIVADRLAKNADLNQKDVQIAIAREACVNMAAISAFAKAPVGQSLWAKILIGIIVVAAIVVACVFTYGAAAAIIAPVLAGKVTAMGAVLITSATVAGTGLAYAAADAATTSQDNSTNGKEKDSQWAPPVKNHGEYFANDWNYIEKITTDFDEEDLTCKKCIEHKNCEKTAWHIFSDRSCSKWEENFSKPRCETIEMF